MDFVGHMVLSPFTCDRRRIHLSDLIHVVSCRPFIHGIHICDFLFAFLETRPSQKKGSKCFTLRVDDFS